MASKADFDVEKHGRRHDPARLDGYPSLAHFISQDGDAQIYRRFARLGARNLLYHQSIVASLEKKLDELDRCDAENNAPGRGHPAIRDAARRLPRIEDGDGIERVNLRQEIAMAMRDYRENSSFW